MSTQIEMATIFFTGAAHRPHGTVEPLDDHELILPDLLGQIPICEEIGSVTAEAPIPRKFHRLVRRSAVDDNDTVCNRGNRRHRTCDVPLFVFREGHAGVGSGKKRREAGTRGGVIEIPALPAVRAKSTFCGRRLSHPQRPQ